MQKFSTKLIQEQIKNIIHQNHVSVTQGVQGCFNIHKPINVNSLYKDLKTQSTWISWYRQKRHLQIQHPFMIEALTKLAVEELRISEITLYIVVGVKALIINSVARCVGVKTRK